MYIYIYIYIHIYIYIYIAWVIAAIAYQRRDACMPAPLSDLERCCPILHKREYTYHYAHAYLCVHATRLYKY